MVEEIDSDTPDAVRTLLSGFYWFTLEAAPAADIHWMTPDELDTYGFAASG